MSELISTICPVCGSGNIDVCFDADDNFVHESCGCNDCNSGWYNHYKLVDQEVVIEKGVRL